MRAVSAFLVLLSIFLVGFEWEGRLSRLRRELDDAGPARRREVVRLLADYPSGEVAEAVLSALEDEDSTVRSEAARTAGILRVERATETLVDWLDDEDSDVRTSAASALGEIGDDEAVPGLVRALGDTSEGVRIAAVRALAATRNPEAVVPVIGRLDDSDPNVRVAAARSLANMADPRAVVPLIGRAQDDSPEVRVAVYDALGDVGDRRALAALLIGLREDHEGSQLAAIRAMGRVGAEDAVPPLVTLLSETPGARHRAVIAALSAIRSRRSVDAIVSSLDSPATGVIARQALSNIATIEPEIVLGSMIAALDNAHTGQVPMLAQTLVEISEHASIAEASPTLLRLLRSNTSATTHLLTALAGTGAPEALIPILEQLESPEMETVGLSLTALETLFDHLPPDGRAADPLLSVLGRLPTAQQPRVVRLLGRIRATRALPELRPLLDSNHEDLRRAAVSAIGRIGDPNGAQALLPMVDDRNARTRYEVARALGTSASNRELEALLEHFVARAPFDRHVVLVAFESALPRLSAAGELDPDLGHRILTHVGAAAEGPDLRLAARAIDVLAVWNHPEVTERLIALTSHEHLMTRSIATRALGQKTTAASLSRIRELVQSPSPALRTAALAALADRGSREDVAALLALATEARTPVSGGASFALARLSSRELLTATDRDQLCRVAARRDPVVRANGILALSHAGLTCPGITAERLIRTPHAGIVRTAAAHWLREVYLEGPEQARVARALASCAEGDLSPSVATACAIRAGAAESPRSDRNVYVYDQSGEELLAEALVTVAMSDGTVWIGTTDPNGHVHIADVPRGDFQVESALSHPLEPN